MQLMMLSVKGEGLLPYRRLVSVVDRDEFVALIRISCLKQILRSDPDRKYHSGILKELNVTLKDTGLVEYPETPQEVEEIFRRMS